MYEFILSLKPKAIAAIEEQLAAYRSLGECAWTMHVDNTFGQPGVKA